MNIQPKAAGPVGAEALREALKALKALADDYAWSGKHARGGYAESHPLTAARAILASHPTTGQEAVATPRDGGVREHEGVRIVEFVTGGYTEVRIGFNNRSDAVEYSAQITPDFVPVALSAPGSAGAGETEPGGFGDGRRICEALGFDPANHHNALKCPYCNPDGLRFATPTTVQPNTGETGEREREIEVLAEHLHEEHDYHTQWTWPEHAEDEGYRGSNGYVTITPTDVQMLMREQASRILIRVDQIRRRSAGLPPTPATKAETPGPADQTKGGL